MERKDEFYTFDLKYWKGLRIDLDPEFHGQIFFTLYSIHHKGKTFSRKPIVLLKNDKNISRKRAS